MAQTTLTLTAQDNASPQINKVSQSMQGMSAAATQLMGALGAAGLLAVAGKSIQEFNNMEKGAKLLDATLKSTGRAAEITSKEIYDMAGALQDVTTYGDDATVEATRMLLTFNNLSTKELPRSIKAIQDMNTAMGGGDASLKGVSMQVGKALNDPIQGLTTLRRVGVQFSEAQQDVIKQMVETGNMAGAQAIILETLEKKFGGAAEAARDTFGGAVQALNNSIGDAQEEIGRLLAEALTPIVKALHDGVKAWNALDSTTKNVIVTVAGVAAGVLAAEAAFNGLKTGIELASKAMTASPWGLALAGVVALAAGIAQLINENNKFIESQNRAKQAVSDLIDNYENSNAQQFQEALNKVTAEYNAQLERTAKKLNVTTAELDAMAKAYQKNSSLDLTGQFRNQEKALQALVPLLNSMENAQSAIADKGGIVNANLKEENKQIKDNTKLYEERTRIAREYSEKVFRQSATNIEILKKEYADALALTEAQYGKQGRMTEEYKQRVLDINTYYNNAIKSAEEKNADEIRDIYKRYQQGMVEDAAKRAEAEQKAADQVIATVKTTVDQIMTIARTLTGLYDNQLDMISRNLDARIAALDEAMARELEAAGLADKTDKEQADERLATLRESLAQAQSEEEQAAIQAEIIEAEKAARKAGIIEQYNTQKSEAEKAAAMETYKVEKAQFETNKAISLIQVAIDTAAGIMKNYASFDAITASVLSAVTLGAGVAQAAVISGQQPPAPPAFADGGTMPYSGTALVGERGPELVRLPAGAEVITAEQTRAAMGGINIYGPITVMADDVDAFRRELLNIARYEGAR